MTLAIVILCLALALPAAVFLYGCAWLAYMVITAITD